MPKLSIALANTAYHRLI